MVPGRPTRIRHVLFHGAPRRTAQRIYRAGDVHLQEKRNLFTFSKSTPTNRTKNLSGRGNTNIDALFFMFLCTELPNETRKLFIGQLTRTFGNFVLLAVWKKMYSSEKGQFTRCSTLQHTATHCNTLQHTATHCNTCDTLQHSFLGKDPQF